MAQRKTFDTLLGEALLNLKNETGIDASNTDSIARALIEGPLREVSNLWLKLSEIEKQTAIATAYDDGLDQIGELVGIKRKRARVGISSPTSMKFYMSSVPGQNIIIPADTQVWPQGHADKFFLTQYDITIPADGTEAFCSIKAPNDGSYYTAAPMTLNMHNVNNASIKCINLEGVSGSDREEDENYRFRLYEAQQLKNTTLPKSLTALILSIPGISDVKLLPQRRGPGTIDIVVYTNETSPGEDFINTVQDYVQNDLVSYGIVAKVYAPEIITVGLIIKITFTQDTSSNEKATLREASIAAVRRVINTLNFGETLYLERLESAIAQLSQSIVGVSFISMSVNNTTLLPDTVYSGEYQRVIAGRIEVT